MPLILRIAIPVPLHRAFDYLLPENYSFDNPKPGVRVLVPFGSSNKIGVLLEIRNTSGIDSSRLKSIHEILDSHPLISKGDVELLQRISRYYHHPVGEVIGHAFPVALRKGKPALVSGEKYLHLSENGRKANSSVFKRAPRQALLMDLLRTNPKGLGPSELEKLDWNWRDSARRLTAKGLIDVAEMPQNKSNLGPSPPTHTANKAQQSAIDLVRDAFGEFSTFLLEGVTGSGKTDVYLQLIEDVVKNDQQAIILLPEIALTPQVQARFRNRFNFPICVFHSGLSQSERRNAWLRMQRGEAPALLGTRSAVFTPMKNPGLIILDEEHDSSFKQQEGFRFSAREIAIMRAQRLAIPIILGSATPSLESLSNAQTGRYQRLHLPERAGNARQPSMVLLDIRNRKLHDGLSEPLIAEIRRVVEHGDQVILFLNRRGFAPTLICHGCGNIARCHRCDANLVVHAADNRLRCHHCGSEHALMSHCGNCGKTDLRSLGLGTERVERTLRMLFPDAPLARIDRDSTRRKGSLEARLDDIASGRVKLLLGTQMLAKGHHFPQVTLVALLDVDAGLFSTDFRSSERLAQLIVQVSGRAGRAQKPGKVILQTRHPEHPLLTALIATGYSGFAEDALVERKAARLPPYSYLALLRAHGVNQHAPLRFLQGAKELADQTAADGMEILGPVAAPMLKRAGRYRYQLLLQSDRRPCLHKLLDVLLPRLQQLKEVNRVRWSLDVDPNDLY